MMHLQRTRVWPWLLVLMACGGGVGDDLTGPTPAPEASPGATVRASGVEKQGVEKQGVEKQGASLFGSAAPTDHLLSTLKLDGETLWDARVEEGELMACRQPALESPELLRPCKKPQRGRERACGWFFAGNAPCAPKAKVLVGAGVDGYGSASEPVVLRICDGVRGCAHKQAVASSGETARVAFFCPMSGHFSVFIGSEESRPTRPVARAESSVGSLCLKPLRGTALIGATLIGVDAEANRAQFTIQDIVPEEAERFLPDPYPYRVGRTFLYALEGYNLKRPGEGHFPLCGPDAEGKRLAIPLAGVWDATWGRATRADRFTFACTSGVLAKCYRWGYRPWLEEVRGMPAVHQACTRMASADYCGDGTSHTVTGTSIDLWDRLEPLPIQRRAGHQEAMVFEAGWGESGAVCLSHLRWKNLPETLDPRLQCPHQLLDPDSSWPSQQPIPTVCDSEEEARERFPWDLHLFNTSLENVYSER